MENLKSKDFYKKEDSQIQGECEDCGHVWCDEEDECPECHSNDYLCTTSLEGEECSICGITFDMFTEDAVENDDDVVICVRCLNKLEENEELKNKKERRKLK